MLLINQHQVITLAFIPREKIALDSIRPVKIDIAQELFIRPMFGDLMFQEMVQGAHEQFVVDYLHPALAHFVRYAVVDELSVQVTGNGALVFLSSTSEVIADGVSTDKTTNSSDTQTHQTTDTLDDGTTTKKLNDETTCDINSDETQLSNPSNINNIKTAAEITTQIQTLTDSNKLKKQFTLDDQTIAEASVKKDSTDKQTSQQVKEALRPASAIERRVIKQRAIADANILLDKAVRYVERNRDEFSTYVPAQFATNIFF